MQTRQPVAGGTTPGRALPPAPVTAEARATRADAERLLGDLGWGVTAWPGEEPAVGEESMPEVRSEAFLLGPYFSAWPWPAGVGALLLDARRRGCRVRVLTGTEVARPQAGRAAPDLDAAGAHVRATAVALPSLLLLDGATAVVPRPGGPVGLLRDPAVVRLLYHFAELHWSDGFPLVGRSAAGDDGGQLHQRILQLLAEGAKDETVARTLGISVRTCRRHIAEILARLGAVSRFQAGVNARHVGLLAPGRAGTGARPAAVGGRSGAGVRSVLAS